MAETSQEYELRMARKAGLKYAPSREFAHHFGDREPTKLKKWSSEVCQSFIQYAETKMEAVNG
jgi:hypothetical protein